MPGIRERLTPEQRAMALEHTIDPGFVHHRKIQTILGTQGMTVIDDLIARLPAELPEWQKKVRIDHIYTHVMLMFCSAIGIKPLEEILVTRYGPRQLFCSTETLAPCPELYDVERALSLWVPRGDYDSRVEFHYSTRHIASDTLRARLHQGDKVSIIAELYDVQNGVIIFHPLV